MAGSKKPVIQINPIIPIPIRFYDWPIKRQLKIIAVANTINYAVEKYGVTNEQIYDCAEYIETFGFTEYRKTIYPNEPFKEENEMIYHSLLDKLITEFEDFETFYMVFYTKTTTIEALIHKNIRDMQPTRFAILEGRLRSTQEGIKYNYSSTRCRKCGEKKMICKENPNRSADEPIANRLTCTVCNFSFLVG
jgi:DNA-directed RNA polymerase subunit M/transcription elongation factor TFIIS